MPIHFHNIGRLRDPESASMRVPQAWQRSAEEGFRSAQRGQNSKESVVITGTYGPDGAVFLSIEEERDRAEIGHAAGGKRETDESAPRFEHVRAVEQIDQHGVIAGG